MHTVLPVASRVAQIRGEKRDVGANTHDASQLFFQRCVFFVIVGSVQEVAYRAKGSHARFDLFFYY
jgi:hypothetical protein